MMSDHIGLRYLFHHLNLNARQTRSLDMINEFDFNIRYIKGKENMMEDAAMGWAYTIGSCRKVNTMSGICLLCTC